MNCHSFREIIRWHDVHSRGTWRHCSCSGWECRKALIQGLKNDLNCVYPYWHPSQDFIAILSTRFSRFFISKERGIEVFDSKSDIVVYDIRNISLLPVNIPSEDSFWDISAFSPDGKVLFFASAKKGIQPDDYDKIKIQFCRIDFDASSGSFGERIDTLVSSFQTGKASHFQNFTRW